MEDGVYCIAGCIFAGTDAVFFYIVIDAVVDEVFSSRCHSQI